jgi:hypothetical protein
MNKLDTTNLGGVSLEWDDIEFEQLAIREAFLGMASAHGLTDADSYIISGCVSTPAGLFFNISAGYIALGGEIFKVDAHNVSSTVFVGNSLFWDRLLTDDPAGLEQTKNLGVVNTYKIRKAFVNNALTPVGGFMPMVAKTIYEKISDGIRPFFGSWTTIDLENSADLVQNDAVDGVGNDIVLFGLPVVGSYIKYQIVGKTVNVQLYIKNFIVTDFAVSPAWAVILNNLPFTFKAGQKQGALFYMNGTHLDGLNGNFQLDLRSNKIVFLAQSPQGLAGSIAFNLGYQMQGAPSKNIQSTGNIAPTTWTLASQFTAELN